MSPEDKRLTAAHRVCEGPCVPRLLPRLALGFLVLWLGRNLAVDVASMPGAAALASPFRSITATHDPAPQDGLQTALEALRPALRRGESVSARARSPIDPSATRWWCGYWLFPHRVVVEDEAQAPSSDVVVVVTAGPDTEAPAGYSPITVRRWSGGTLWAFRRGGGT